MKFVKKCSATVLAVSMVLTCAAASACVHTHDFKWRYNTTQHWKACEADGEIEEGSSAAHDFSGSSTCECGYVKGSSIDYGSHVHSYTQWGSNSTQHWKECPDDREIDANSYGAHSYVNGVCECGKTEGSATNPDPNVPPPTPGVTHTVTFVTNTTQTYGAQSVSSGSTVSAPTGLSNDGKYLAGWYTTANFAEGTAFNFATAVTKDYTLYAKWIDLNKAVKEVKTYNESLAVEWEEANPAAATVQYKPVSGGDYVTVDKALIRSYDDGARVDIVGLKAGSYSVKITPSSGTSFDIPEIAVTAYDRSGYAHFNYSEGVGAYNDDGTLKDGAIVIYVTDENKDYVMRDVAATNSAVTMFKVPGSDWGGKNADGIGWWLNNAQYTKTTKSGEKGNTWTANGNSLGFKSVDKPIVLRFIGTVTTPEGCTAYNSLNEGGSEGDNGHMARMRNLKNITVEGVGEDAVIQGWGFHFMTGSDAVNGQGKSFEVRNLTFDKYPEDAIGMEGVQEGGKITGSVERCWIHNNTFLPGYCANPAESDKKEGDGSCDFKRGEYFTCSYNYFTDCHKTNLIGSSDSSLQYNLTYHHNWWHNCGSRIPLARQANVHFYNNYISTDTTTKAGISYVHSIRANANLFSEGNYYFGCKQIGDSDFKSYNNTILGCFKIGSIVNVTNREQKVSNGCKHFNGTDLSAFDTNPALFYYDAQNKKSDCLLDDSVTARQRAIRFAGCNGWGENNPKKAGDAQAAVKELMNEKTPAETVQIADNATVNVDFANPPKGIIVDGTANGNLKSTKGKGQMVIINLATPATLTATSSSTGDLAPQIISADGRLYATVEGTASVEVPAGIYIICVGNYSYDIKQSVLESLSIKSAANSTKIKFETLNEAIDALPANITVEYGALIKTAQNALDSLTAQELEKYKTENSARYTKITNAIAAYDNLAVNDCIAKINAIGTVNQSSGDKIYAAQEAYNALNASQKGKVTNYSTLTAALAAWSNFAVQGVNDQIAALVDVSAILITDQAAIANAKAAYEKAQTAYNNLDDGSEEGETNQKAQVTNYKKVTDGLAEIAKLEKLFDFKEYLAAFEGTTVNGNNLAAASALKTLYTELSAQQKAALTGDEQTKYTAIEKSLTDFAGKAIECSFEGAPGNNAFTVSGNYTGCNVTVNGHALTKCLKIESSTSVKFTTSVKMTLTLYLSKSGKIKIDGASKESDGSGVVTVTVEAGSHTITKDTSLNLYYATLTPAT